MSNSDLIDELNTCAAGMSLEDEESDIWVKSPEGKWHALGKDGKPHKIGDTAEVVAVFAPLTFLGVSERLLAHFKERATEEPAEPARPRLCGAEDVGYQLLPDEEPTPLGPCILEPGHFPTTMHESPQTDPTGRFENLPNVRWGTLAGHKIVQHDKKWDTAPKSLHELVKEGRYFLQSNNSEELMWGCNEHIDTEKTDEVTAAAFTTDCTDPVEILKWIEEHEKEHHK